MKNLIMLFCALLPYAIGAQSYQVGSVKVALEGKDENFVREAKVVLISNGLYELEITLQGKQAAMPKPISIKFKQPSLDIQSYLSPYGATASSEPTSLYNFAISRMLPVSFDSKQMFTSAMMDQPSITLVNNNSKNRLTLAASELFFPVIFSIGENEDGGVAFDTKVGLFEYPTKAMTSYKIKIRFDVRDINYNTAQRDLLEWWKVQNNLAFAYVPQKAHMPFYCTWYALKADGVNAANVEQQAALAKRLGCETIIVDDGWQKAQDATVGYCAYNGDWEVDAVRFKDFKGHVKKVQDMGMAYMLWVGPSMVGEKSKVYQKLKDKMLYKADWASAWVLDPRFPEVRKYLSERLITLMKESGIDGFKIDFLDLFNSRFAGKNMAMGNGRDYESVEEATVKMIADIYAGCKALNPDVLIEFRQFYTNPVLQQYANMFRAIDCPNDIMENRTRTLDGRNLNHQVIHADPLAWNATESPEAAALQFLHTMLSVPQISTDLANTNAAQQKMLGFLLKQWREFNNVLTRGKAFSYGPDSHYSWSEVSLDDQTVVVAYQPTILNPQTLNKNVLMINGTHQNKLVFDFDKDFGTRDISIYNCSGDLISKSKLKLKGLVKITVPMSGIVRVF